MLVVLMQRALDFRGVPRGFLYPILMIRLAEDPNLRALSFNHKHAVPGEDNVVDLGGAVFRGQGDVLDQVVVVFVEEQASRGVNNEFAQMAFEPGRTEYR